MLTKFCLTGLVTACVLIAAEPSSAPVTFNKDVLPILQRHCQSCHRPGEAAPFSMLAYSEVRPWSKSIREAVVLRKMPPWFADSALGHFANDPRLSAAEISAIRAWVDAGAPEGNTAEAPPSVQFTDHWKIGKPDLIVELPVDYQVPATGTVDYVWLATDMKLTEDKWIERVEVRPGSRSVVHHALAFTRAPGSKFHGDLQPGSFQSKEEKGQPESQPQTDDGLFAIGNSYGSGAEMIGDYVPNGDPFIAGPGQARLIRAGSHLLFQMHYTTNGRPTTDRTQVGIVFAKQPPKERIVNDAVVNQTIRIPPGAANHEARAVVTFQGDTEISDFGPHMHVRGKAMRYELIRKDTNKTETLLNVPAYNFNWQLKYQPRQWVRVHKGDQLRVTAWYDNSPNNSFNPDASREVRWGGQTWDEMLFAFFDFVIPADSSPETITGGPRKLNASR
ncbi:MAG TPA: cytochrome c [Bryobacteraceae bacterium]|nr:cytochrome c [Bryobacteraceae bacterium]